jgi:hypothetical protein
MSKINLNVVKLDLIKIFLTNNLSNYAILINKILMTFDNFSVKNIDKVTKKFLDPLLNCLVKGDDSLLFNNFEPNYKTSMFIMKTFRSAFLMKSKDFQKDAEELSRDIFFYLFKEFDNKHFRENLYL